MTKTIDCTECKGEGKITITNYREMEEKTLEEQIKKPSKFERIAGKIAKSVMIGVGASGLVYGGAIGIIAWAHACDRQQRESAYEHFKDGIILVEYDRDGKPTNCVVERDGTYKTSGSTRSVSIWDRHDDSIIERDAKMLGWDDTKQKCIRFHYDIDDK
jgi:hypothetical protein